MNNKVTAIRYCNWCGDPFEVKSPNQKYCPPSKSDCSIEAKRESWRKAADKYRKKYKNVLQISQVYKMGTGFLGCKPYDDFDEEYAALVKEKKRLKLNGIIFVLSPLLQYVCRPLLESPVNRSISSFEVLPLILVFGLILGFVTLGAYYN